MVLYHETRGDEQTAIVQTESQLAAVVESLEDGDFDGTVTIVAPTDVLEAACDGFTLGGRLQDFINDGVVEVVSASNISNSVVISGGSISSIVETGEGILTVESDDHAEMASEYAEGLTERSEAFDMEIPGYTEFTELLAEEFGDEMASDFENVCSETDLSSVRDVVTVLVLLGAKNEALQFDLSETMDESGLASKATVSRVKSQLEDQGLIETQKVTAEIGRPPLRLLLPDDTSDMSGTEVASQVLA